jgi:hypothetical protein
MFDPSASATSRLAEIHSRIVKNGADHSLPPRSETYHLRQEPKLLDVTITILSLTGFRAKENKNRISISADGNRDMTNAACKMVASFENGAKAETSHGTPMTHIPSLSFQLPSPFRHSSTFSDIVSWPEQAAECFWPEQANEFANMSSYQFQRKFVPEGGTGRLQPQVCPIQISVSRNGNMYKLGVASVLVNGEEGGESSTIIPITIDERVFSGAKQQLDELKMPMVTLKGDTMKCSLERNSSIRVLVKVSDPKSTDFTKPVSHFIEDPALSAVSNESDEGQGKVEEEKEAVQYDMDAFSGATLSRAHSKETSIRSAPTDSSSDFSSALDSHPYSTDDEYDDWSIYSASSSGLAKLKDQLRNGGWLRSPTSHDDSASASLDDTTISSSSSITTASVMSEMVSSVRNSFPDSKSKAKSWVNRFACGVQLCGCKDKEGDLLLSAVDENTILIDTYSLKHRE